MTGISGKLSADKQQEDDLVVHISGQAVLSSEENYTVFKFDKYLIRFQTSYSLEKYTEVKEWDNGYIVVMAKYSHSDEDIEEYIDLLPILDLLYIDADEFLAPIEGVIISYA